MNSVQRQIEPLNPQIGLNVYANQRRIQPLNPQLRFNVKFIERQI